MKQSEFKKLLIEQMRMESDLSDYVKELLNELYKDESEKVRSYVVNLFEEDIDCGYEYNGCIQGLHYIKTRVAEQKKKGLYPYYIDKTVKEPSSP